MSTGKHIRRRAIITLSVLITLTVVGCQALKKKSGQDEQPIVIGEVQTQIDTEREAGNAEGELTNIVNITDAANAVNDIDEGNEETVQPDEQSEDEERQEKPQPPEGWELKLASEDWGLSYRESGMQPVGNAAAEDLAWYDAYYVGDDSEKIIYLTIDCGYENGNTEAILGALRKHSDKATFFVTGYFLETAPDMAKRIVEEGHAVGNHTYHHPDMSAISDYEDFQKEMNDVADLFYEITGTELSKYYRPPQGKCNTQNLKMAQELGYNTIFWSLAHVDWNQDAQPSHEEALKKLTSRIHPGAIVLLHNSSKTNGEILDELLTKWEEMGYSLKPLSDLTDR